MNFQDDYETCYFSIAQTNMDNLSPRLDLCRHEMHVCDLQTNFNFSVVNKHMHVRLYVFYGLRNY